MCLNALARDVWARNAGNSACKWEAVMAVRSVTGRAGDAEDEGEDEEHESPSLMVAEPTRTTLHVYTYSDRIEFSLFFCSALWSSQLLCFLAGAVSDVVTQRQCFL